MGSEMCIRDSNWLSLNLNVDGRLGLIFDSRFELFDLKTRVCNFLSPPSNITVRSNCNASSKEQASDIVNQLNAGSTLGDCFTSLKEFNPIYAHSIANAEQAGELSNALRTIAERMERDFADKALRLTQLVEPVLILVMGVLIGLIVYGLFSAISGLSTTI